MLDIRRAQTPAGDVHLTVAGEIDLATAPDLENALAAAMTEAAAASGAELTVDLSDVGFIDSTGVSVLVRSAQKAEQSGTSVRVLGAQGVVARVLRVTGVADYLRVPDDRA
jgi:anti-anti-sigma factor